MRAGLIDHEVQMGGAKVMAARGAHQIADGAIDGNWVTRRLDAAEIETSVFAGDKAPAQIHLGLTCILIFIETFRRGMPDIDLGARDRTAACIFE